MSTYILTQEEINALDIVVENYFRNLLEIPIVESFYNSNNKIIKKTSFIKLVVINDNDLIPECVKNIYYDCKYYNLSNKRFIFYYDNNETNEKPIEYFDLLNYVHTIAYSLSGVNKLTNYPRADYALCTADYKNNKFEITYTPTTIILFIGLCILNNLNFKLLQDDNIINETISKLNISKEEYLKNNVYNKYNYQFLGNNITLNYNNTTKMININVNNKNVGDIDFNNYIPFIFLPELSKHMENLSRVDIILIMMKDFVKSIGF